MANKRPTISVPKPRDWDWTRMDAGLLRKQTAEARRVQLEATSYLDALDAEVDALFASIRERWQTAKLQEMQRLNDRGQVLLRERRKLMKQVRDIQDAITYIEHRSATQREAA